MKKIVSESFLLFAVGCGLSGLSACSLLQRSAGSGYYSPYEDAAPDYRDERAASMREKAAGELGFASTRQLNRKEREALNLRVQLNESERRLEGRAEREQYFKNRPLMTSDSQRLEFLGLPSFEARERWLGANGISEFTPAYSPNELKAIEANDITLGMTRQAVKESWGEPELVEVAGNPIYGNERWKYLQEVSSSEGYKTETRVIYFESGRVAGWQKGARP